MWWGWWGWGLHSLTGRSSKNTLSDEWKQTRSPLLLCTTLGSILETYGDGGGNVGGGGDGGGGVGGGGGDGGGIKKNMLFLLNVLCRCIGVIVEQNRNII